MFFLTGAALSSCQFNPQELMVNTATGAVAGAVIANQGEEQRQDLVGQAIGSPKTDTQNLSQADLWLDQQEKSYRNLLAGSGISVNRLSDRIVLSIPERVSFEPNSVQLKTSLRPALVAISNSVLNAPNSVVQVVGHSDNQDSEARRNYISTARAKEIAKVLQSNGVAPLRLQVYGLAETYPIASNDTENGRALNRRVEIYILPLAK